MKNLKNYVIGKIKGLFYSPKKNFLSHAYIRHNQRRLEHLASLRLKIENSTVLELGTGIGDHTGFFLDRNCQVYSTDSRKENLKMLRSRYPKNSNLKIELLNLENKNNHSVGLFDIVYCYGLLYHLGNPKEAIEYMSKCCVKMMLLETCVSMGDGEEMNLCSEISQNPTQSSSGTGCRPTRKFVYNQLKKYFDFVYMPLTQPHHEQFPIDWNQNNNPDNLKRAVFIASREKIKNDLLIEGIPMNQKRH